MHSLINFEQSDNFDVILKQGTEQLVKDLVLAGVQFEFSVTSLPDLIQAIRDLVKQLHHTNAQSLFNFLYRLDLPEKQVLLLQKQHNEINFIEELAKEIVKKTFTKVIFRNNLKKKS